MKYPKFFQIVDGHSFFHGGEVFESIKEAWEALANYHDIDFEGEDDNGNPMDIYEALEKEGSDNKKLDWLLEWGQWDIQEAQGVKCPLCGVFIVHQHVGESDIWACPECPFVGFEFFGERNVKDLTTYINKQHG